MNPENYIDNFTPITEEEYNSGKYCKASVLKTRNGSLICRVGEQTKRNKKTGKIIWQITRDMFGNIIGKILNPKNN